MGKINIYSKSPEFIEFINQRKTKSADAIKEVTITVPEID